MPGAAKLTNLTDIRSSVSLRRFLIDLNVQLDLIKSWTDQNGNRDHYTSLTCDYFIHKRLPQVVIDILLLEDRRFFRHHGFELRSIARGAKRWWRYGKLGGVSTIDQLLVRTVLKRTERTAARKAREVTLAVLLNLHFSKYTILMAFSNCAYFGPSLNGADTAAIVIFGSRANQLDHDQSAFIASLLPYPLPKNIKSSLLSKGPRSSPDEILNNFESSNPWWVSRVRLRMAYLEDLRVKYSGAF
jgi:hypothetical protein